MARIELDHVTKVYPGAPPAVNDLTLDIPDGSFMVLVGPSGSGKSTALRMVAGLEDVTEGEIRIGGRVVNDVPAKDRDIAMVFQNYALYPHMTVEENLSFSLQLHKTPKQEQAHRVAEAARILGLERFLDRQVILGIRPSSFEDAAFAPPGWPRIRAEARVTERLGSEVDVIFAVKTPPVEHEVMVAQFDPAANQPAGQDQEQTGGLVGEGESLWTASVNPHTSVRPGRAIELAVDTSALYWFDPDSSQAIPRQAAGDRPGSDQDPTPPGGGRAR